MGRRRRAALDLARESRGRQEYKCWSRQGLDIQGFISSNVHQSWALGPNRFRTISMLRATSAFVAASVGPSCVCTREVIDAAVAQRDFWHSEFERLRCQHERHAFGVSSLTCTQTQQIMRSSQLTACARCPSPTDEARLSKVEEETQQWRRDAGRISCEHEGRGPSGGFCMTKRVPNGGDANLASSLAVLFSNATVLDLGCGTGACESAAPKVPTTGAPSDASPNRLP